ncbi:hypothetical protein KIPB_007444, partial [Kipferlia bialata]
QLPQLIQLRQYVGPYLDTCLRHSRAGTILPLRAMSLWGMSRFVLTIISQGSVAGYASMLLDTMKQREPLLQRAACTAVSKLLEVMDEIKRDKDDDDFPSPPSPIDAVALVGIVTEALTVYPVQTRVNLYDICQTLVLTLDDEPFSQCVGGLIQTLGKGWEQATEDDPNVLHMLETFTLLLRRLPAGEGPADSHIEALSQATPEQQRVYPDYDLLGIAVDLVGSACAALGSACAKTLSHTQGAYTAIKYLLTGPTSLLQWGTNLVGDLVEVVPQEVLANVPDVTQILIHTMEVPQNVSSCINAVWAWNRLLTICPTSIPHAAAAQALKVNAGLIVRDVFARIRVNATCVYMVHATMAPQDCLPYWHEIGTHVLTQMSLIPAGRSLLDCYRGLLSMYTFDRRPPASEAETPKSTVLSFRTLTIFSDCMLSLCDDIHGMLAVKGGAECLTQIKALILDMAKTMSTGERIPVLRRYNCWDTVEAVLLQ